MNQSALTIYPLQNCKFGTSRNLDRNESHFSSEAELTNLRERFAAEGTCRSVAGVLVVHQHGHPHILLLQYPAEIFQIPGGKLLPGEAEVEALRRILTELVSPADAAMAIDWQIGECLATYWRPNFEPSMYPYLPVHISHPKEIRRLLLVHLPEHCYFAVPQNAELLAIPLYDCHHNLAKFGSIIAALPELLSRYRITAVDNSKAM